MPLPKPHKNETKKKFMDRCMANPTMNKEYEEEDQRYAVCQSLWKQNKRGISPMTKKVEPKNNKLADTVERRSIPTEVRIIRNKDNEPKIAGLAAVFDKFSENLGGFVERILPGAFTEALKTSDARALVNHDSNLLLGRESAGTLEVKQSKHGLDVEISPPDTQAGRDVVTSIERGDIQGMSFGFRVAPNGDTWEETDDGRTIRTISEIKELFDISPVTFPAYPDTKVALRSLDEWRGKNKQSNSDGVTAPGDKDATDVLTHRPRILRRKLENKLKLIESEE